MKYRETEGSNVKQLGINMSVANLEAYALTKGITKAFSEMSQGEQTMLRYQYLMQATADAQGDFARTSDGYANSLRQLETNIETLKTNIGSTILPIVNEVIGGINDMMGALTQSKPKTVLDEFAEIDLQTSEKLANIQATADEAYALIGVLEDLGGKQISSASLTSFVSSLTGKLGELDDAMTAAENGDYAGTISAIAQAMAQSTGTDATAWETLLGAIGASLPGAVNATLDDKGQVEAFLKAAGNAAASLGGEYPALWAQMLTVLGDDAGAAISALATGATAAAALEGLANGANTLSQQTSVDKWKALLTTLSDASGINIPASTGKSIEELANALNGNDPNTDRATAWGELLTMLGENIAGLSAATGADVSSLTAWLDGLEESVSALEPTDVAGFTALWDELQKGLPTITGVANWTTLLNAIDSATGANLSGLSGGISGLANALNGNDPKTDRAAAWTKLLDALQTDITGIANLTGTTEAQVIAWLVGVSDAANKLDPDSAEGWDKVMAMFEQGPDGVDGSSLIDAMTGLADGADDADKYLKILGYDTDKITDTHAAWLEVAKNLVKTIPGLSEIIDTETGAVKGGSKALQEYVEEWIESEKKMALWSAHFAKGQLLEQRRSEEYSSELERMTAEQRLKINRQRMNAILANYGITGTEDLFNAGITPALANERRISIEDQKEFNALAEEGAQLQLDAADAAKKYRDAVDANSAAVEAYQLEEQALTEQFGEVEQATDAATDSMSEFEKAVNGDQDALSNMNDALTAASDALKAVDDYYNKVRDSTTRTLEGVAGGFGKVITPAQKAQQTVKNLNAEMERANAEAKEGYQRRITEANGDIPSIQNMTAGLQSQLAFLNQYKEDLEKARARGIDEDILAYLSDGSAESADYLHQLAGASVEEAKTINAQWAAVATAREELADSLTDTQLGVDEEFQNLVQTADDAIKQLDMYSDAKGALEDTVQGIADGIANKIPSTQAAVDGLNAVLSTMGGNTFLSGLFNGFKLKVDGSAAVGMDYVPFDNYLAQLHEGESVLTAEEARVWRAFKYSGASSANNIDYDAMGGVMRDNIKPGGNVYLDGRIVGHVISARQADTMRGLERSGWQG